MTKNEEKLKNSFTETVSDIACILGWFQDELDRYEGEKTTWGKVSNLRYARKNLIETLGFLSNSKNSEIETALEEMRM